MFVVACGCRLWCAGAVDYWCLLLLLVLWSVGVKRPLLRCVVCRCADGCSCVVVYWCGCCLVLCVVLRGRRLVLCAAMLLFAVSCSLSLLFACCRWCLMLRLFGAVAVFGWRSVLVLLLCVANGVVAVVRLVRVRLFC